MSGTCGPKWESGCTDQRHRFRLCNTWIEIHLRNGLHEPISEAIYVLYLSNGKVIEGKLDEEGMVRKENLPPGGVDVEFPDFFEVFEIEEDGTVVWNRGSPPPLDEYYNRIPSDDPAARASTKPTYADVDQDSDDDDEALDKQYLGWQDEMDDEDEMDEEDDIEDDMLLDEIPDEDERFVDKEEEIPDAFSVAMAHCKTGKKYVFGIMRCLSIHLYWSDRKKMRQRPARYKILNSDGEVVSNGTCRDGVVFVDELGIDDYELIVEGQSFELDPVADAEDVTRIILQSPPPDEVTHG